MKFWLLLLLALGCAAHADTVIVATPGCDDRGWRYYRVNRVVQIDGDWGAKPPALDNIILPPEPKSGLHLAKFGEAAIFIYPEAKNTKKYWCYSVHWGCVTAFGGMPADEFIKKLLKKVD